MDLATLSKDPFLAPFLAPEFNSDAYTRSVIRTDSPVSASMDETAGEVALRSVRSRIRDVESCIGALVSANQDDLFRTAEGTTAVKAHTASLYDRALVMQATTSRLRAEVLAPYEDLKRDVQLLQRTLQATELVRCLHRLQLSLRRLKSLVATAVAGAGGEGSGASAQQHLTATGETTLLATVPTAALASEALSNPRVLTRLSVVLAEVLEIMSEGDGASNNGGGSSSSSGSVGGGAMVVVAPSLRGLTIVDAERPWITHLVGSLRGAARGVLSKAAESLHAADVGTACSALADLKCLHLEVPALMDACAEGVGGAVRDALDVRGVAAAAQSAIESSAGVAGGGLGGGGAASSKGLSMPGLGAAVRSGSGSNLMPPPGAVAAWRGALWGRVETVCEGLTRTLLQAWNVYYVLARKTGGSGGGGSGGSMSSSTSSSSSGGTATRGSTHHHTSSSHPHYLLEELFPKGGESWAAHAAEVEAEEEAQGRAPHTLEPEYTPNHPLQRHPAVRALRRFWLVMTRALRKEFTILCSTAGTPSSSDLSSTASAVSTALSAFASSSTSSASSASSQSGTHHSSDFVRGVLLDGYPRLHYILLDFLGKAATSVALRTSEDDAMMGGGVSVGGGGSGGGTGPSTPHITGTQLLAFACNPDRIHWATAPLWRLYLGRSMTRLQECVGAVFPSGMEGKGKKGAGGGGGGDHHHRGGESSIAGDGLLHHHRPSASSSSSSSSSSSTHHTSPTTGFTTTSDMEKFMEESPPTPSPHSATPALIKAIAAELAACRPPNSVGGMSGGMIASVGGVGGSGGSVGGGMGAAAIAAATSRLALLSGAAALPPSFVAAIGCGSGGVGSVKGPVSASSSSPASGSGDPHLYFSVAKNVATALKLLAAKAEGVCITTPSAFAAAEHWMPTPAQTYNLSVASRLDEVRQGVAKVAGEVPLLPYSLAHRLGGIDPRDPVLIKLGAARAHTLPLAHPLPITLAVVSAAQSMADAAASAAAASSATSAAAAASTTSGAASTMVVAGEVPHSSAAAGAGAVSPLSASLSSSPQSLLLSGLSSVDKALEGVLSPWLSAVTAPLQHCISRLHEQSYTALGGGGDAEWAVRLESHAQGLVSHQFQYLGGGGLSVAIRAALASRCLTIFVRHAALVKPLDESGRLKLARDAAAVELAVSNLSPPGGEKGGMGSGGGGGGGGGGGDAGSGSSASHHHHSPPQLQLSASIAELRAFRSLLFASTAEVAGALGIKLPPPSTTTTTATATTPAPPTAKEIAAMERLATAIHSSLQATNLVHALLARLPKSCPMPSAKKGMTPRVYSDWMDGVAVVGGGGVGGGGGEELKGATAASPTHDFVTLTRAKLFTGKVGKEAQDKAVAKLAGECLEDFRVANSLPGGEGGEAAAQELTLLTKLLEKYL